MMKLTKTLIVGDEFMPMDEAKFALLIHWGLVELLPNSVTTYILCEPDEQHLAAMIVSPQNLLELLVAMMHLGDPDLPEPTTGPVKLWPNLT